MKRHAAFVRTRRWGAGTGAGLALAALFIGGRMVWSSDRATGASRPAQGNRKATRSSSLDEAKIQQQLQQIVENQQLILQKFDAIMEELRIIKVRATIRSSGS